MKYHPCTILFRLYNLIKNSFFLAIILFVLNKDSTAWYFLYGRYAFIIFIIWRITYILMAWFFEKYEWKEQTFHLQKGIFIRHSSTIPFSKIQNVTRKTTVFHKIFGLTSLTFETSMDGEDDSIQFEVISTKHANELIQLVQARKEDSDENKNSLPLEDLETSQERIDGVDQDLKSFEEINLKPKQAKTVHFTSEKKDLLKASFTSLSFLAIIPLTFAALDNLEPFLPEKNEIDSLFQIFANNYLLLSVTLVLAIGIAIIFGIANTFIRYGNYEIASDEKYIYIKRGLLNESEFTIEKKKIQGLEIVQPVLKRLFGLAEVKIISSASPSDDGKINVNSLYPFLPKQKAYALIEELLPIYQCDTPLERLPKISLLVKLIRPSWFGIIATIALLYFKPDLFQIDKAWLIIIIALFCFIMLQRILDYKHTGYAVTGDQLQWWKGGLTTKMFITKRKNMIEMSYSQSRLQHRFQLASISAINRSTPPRIEVINDLPFFFAQRMEKWYRERLEDIELVKNEEELTSPNYSSNDGENTSQ